MSSESEYLSRGLLYLLMISPDERAIEQAEECFRKGLIEEGRVYAFLAIVKFFVRQEPLSQRAERLLAVYIGLKNEVPLAAELLDQPLRCA